MTAIESDVRNEFVAWAESTPRIRRAWIVGSRAKGSHRPDSDIDIAVELEPVADSEETLAVWMGNAEKWQSQLQARVEPTVDLKWFDPDGGTPLPQDAVLVYERAGN